MALIGFAGRAGSGKTTFAKFFEQRHGFTRTFYAAPLKRVVKDLFMLEDIQLTDFDAKERIDPRWGISPRTMMQLFGTEFVRRMIDNDFWLKRMAYFLKSLPEGTDVVIDDVRFPNEANQIRLLGGVVVHIYREDSPLQSKYSEHESELGLDIMPNDIVIHNRLLEDSVTMLEIYLKECGYVPK